MEPGEYDNIVRLEERHWWYLGMRRIAERMLNTIGLRAGARILDAGCGTGGALKWLCQFGTVAGIDFHPRAVHFASQQSQCVAQASIQAIPFRDSTFDLVTCFDVLYHLAVNDDVQALREMAAVLRPGGWLLVRVPAHDWLRGAHDRQVHTRRRYAARELRQKIDSAGLELQRLTGAGIMLLPVAIIRRLTQADHQARSDVTMPPQFVNRALTRLLAAEGLWVRHFNFPVGLSLLALARKPGHSPRTATLPRAASNTYGQ